MTTGGKARIAPLLNFWISSMLSGSRGWVISRACSVLSLLEPAPCSSVGKFCGYCIKTALITFALLVFHINNCCSCYRDNLLPKRKWKWSVQLWMGMWGLWDASLRRRGQFQGVWVFLVYFSQGIDHYIFTHGNLGLPTLCFSPKCSEAEWISLKWWDWRWQLERWVQLSSLWVMQEAHRICKFCFLMINLKNGETNWYKEGGKKGHRTDTEESGF